MPSACFVDTNVLLYAIDRKAIGKRERAVAWLQHLADRDELIVSPQVLNEFAHAILRKFADITFDELASRLEGMRPWCRAPITDESAIFALLLHRRYRYSFYDSALLAAALSFGCGMFLSEDLRHGHILAEMRIVDPFRLHPSDLAAT